MFSKLAHRIGAYPKEALFLAAAVAVIVGQLFMMADVAHGQVQRAEMRETIRETTRLAVMDCLEANPRLTVRACTARAAMDVAGADAGRYDDGYAAASAVVAGGAAQRGTIVPVNYYAVR